MTYFSAIGCCIYLDLLENIKEYFLCILVNSFFENIIKLQVVKKKYIRFFSLWTIEGTIGLSFSYANVPQRSKVQYLNYECF